MSHAKIIGIAAQLVVTDVQRTAAYYRDILGFRIIKLVGDPPVYAMTERDGFQVHFAKSDTAQIKTNKDFRAIANDLILWVPEIDLFFDELISRKANIIEGIIKRNYGSREFIIEDCDGHRILIGD